MGNVGLAFILVCASQHMISHSNPRIIFPEDEEYFLTKLQKRSNSSGVMEDKVMPITNPINTIEVRSQIRKCCRKGQVLDMWHKCKRRKRVERYFVREIKLLLEDPETTKFTRNVFNCPKRLIQEYVPTNILANGSVVIEKDDKNVTSSDYHCIELTEVESDSYDGLHVVMCNMEDAHSNVGYITKCCSKDKVLNEALETCVDIPGNTDKMNWIPSRAIVSDQTWRPTGQYHLQHSVFPGICNGSGFIDVTPEQFTTAGEVTIMVEDEFTMTEYACVDRVKIEDTDEVTDATALICINDENIEIEKCCPERQVFSLTKQHCVYGKKNQIIWSPYSQFGITNEFVFSIHTDFLHNYLDDAIEDCTEIYNLNSEESEIFLEKDILAISDMKGKYCIDNMYEDDDIFQTLVVICHESLPTSREGRELGVRSGFVNDVDDTDKTNDSEIESCDWTHLRNFFSFLSVISIICLILTLVVYCILPEFNSLHGKIVKSNVGCTMMVHLFLLVVYNSNTMTTGCIFWGYFGYFSNMAMYSWMTIMCFDLGWKFFKSRAPQTSSSSKKFVKYSAFGLGLPVFFTLLAGILQISVKQESDFNPNIGSESCFIDEVGNKQLLFFFLPVFLLMISNVSGFVFTLYLMNKAQASVRGASVSRR